MKTDISLITSLFDKVKTRRVNFESEWDEIADHLFPQSRGFQTTTSDGYVDRDEVLDASPERYAEDLANSLVNMLVGRKEWGALSTSNPEIDLNSADYTRLTGQLKSASEKIHRFLASNTSNFYPTVTKVCEDLVYRGQSFVYMGQDFAKSGRKSMTYHRLPVEECFVERELNDTPSYFFRLIKMTRDNVLSLYNNLEDSELSDNEKRNFKHQQERTGEVQILQVTTSRARLATLGIKIKKDYASVHIYHDLNVILRIDELNNFPILAPSWKRLNGACYGRGPAHRALPDIKTLNRMIETNLSAGESMVTPPFIVPYDLMDKPQLDLSPRALNYINLSDAALGTGLTKPEPLVAVKDIPVSLEMEDRRRQQIASSFYADALSEEKRAEISATEAQINQSNRISKLSIIITNIYKEFLAPAFLFAASKLNEWKYINIDKAIEPDVTFTSALREMQGQAEVQKIERVVFTLTNLKQVPEEVLAYFDKQKLMRHIFDKADISLDILADEATIQREREQSKINPQIDNIAKLAQITQELG